MATLTVYPDAGDPGSTSVDGTVLYDGAALGTWSTTRDATAGTAKNTTADSIIFMRARLVTDSYRVTRGFFLFDTSALTSSANISAATFSIAGTGTATADDDVSTIHIVSSTPAANTTLALEDYDQVGSTSFASLAMASWVTTLDTYNGFALNASGLANISKTGVSKFATRNSRDLDNSAPTGTNQATCFLSDVAGTTSDPKLVITYELIPATGFFQFM